MEGSTGFFLVAPAGIQESQYLSSRSYVSGNLVGYNEFFTKRIPSSDFVASTALVEANALVSIVSSTR